MFFCYYPPYMLDVIIGHMNKILISACLLGQKVRYDGAHNLQNHPRLNQWIKDNLVISICPEVSGGLSTPRDPAEIEHRMTAADVLAGKARIKTFLGQDVTLAYIRGAENTLKLARKHEIKVAILKARSPSCSSQQIYDGTFSKNIIDGVGITAALLYQHGINVFDESQIDIALDKAN